ncbi:MAG: hypothetical protein JWM80_2118 [Cyanobacteria bacterium RYN_339]|nr:hypothetical protein [Cyanobacteria bacterium RYN_339]
MERQHFKVLVAALSVALLAGCGTSVAPIARQHLDNVPAIPAKINRQAATLELQPEAATTGTIAIAFKFPAAKGYELLATPADVAKITVTLKTKSFLLTKTVATAEVTRAQMLNNLAAVQFTGLKGATYTMDIAALDAGGKTIGKSTASADVKEGTTTNVDAKLQIDRSIAAASLGVNLEIVNGKS